MNNPYEFLNDKLGKYNNRNQEEIGNIDSRLKIEDYSNDIIPDSSRNTFSSEETMNEPRTVDLSNAKPLSHNQTSTSVSIIKIGAASPKIVFKIKSDAQQFVTYTCSGDQNDRHTCCKTCNASIWFRPECRRSSIVSSDLVH